MKSTFFHSPRFFSGLGIHALCLRLLLIGFVVAFNARAQVALVPQLAALMLWEPAWEATKDADSGSAKAVADFALALYTKQISLRQQNVNSATSGEAVPALRPRTDQRSEDRQNENVQLPPWQVATSPESTTRSE